MKYQNFILLLTIQIFESENDSRNVEILSDAVKQFSRHFIVFHFEEESKMMVENVLLLLGNVTNCYLMKNYDQITELDGLEETVDFINFTRPVGYRFLHIVLLNDYERFDEYTETSVRSLQYLDVVFFVSNTSGILVRQSEKQSVENDIAVMKRLRTSTNDFPLWKKNSLGRAGGLFIFDSDKLSLYTVCFFCGERTKTLRKIDDLSMDANRRTLLQLARHVNRFNNFHQHVFLVGYNIYKPLFFGR